MFFIVNVNLATEQTNPDVKLPQSSSATPVSKPLAGDVYLNQRVRSEAVMDRLTQADRQRLEGADSIIFISGKQPMSMLEARAWLQTEAQRAKDAAGEGKPLNVTIHFRPEGDLDFNELMKLMQAVKVAGFTKIKMHATIKPGD
jgi:biopolymer transport protein ExbD